MSDNHGNHGNHADEGVRGTGGWQPVPQGGEYDDGATAFVQLPADLDALLGGDPLAAPGHGYVPPMIVPLTPAAATDPAATGTWTFPAAPLPEPDRGESQVRSVQWPDASALPAPTAPEPTHPEPDPLGDPLRDRHATGQWTFHDDSALTGQWTIPVAGGELPDESGEFSTSSLIEQWGTTPPATLPGGAPAPWATEQPQPEPHPDPLHEPLPDAEPAVEASEASAEASAAADARVADFAAQAHHQAPLDASRDFFTPAEAHAAPADFSPPAPVRPEPVLSWNPPGPGATLPGGAPAPWSAALATEAREEAREGVRAQETGADASGEDVADAEPAGAPAAEPLPEPAHATRAQPLPEPEPEPVHAAQAQPLPQPEPEPAPEPVQETAPDPEPRHESEPEPRHEPESAPAALPLPLPAPEPEPGLPPAADLEHPRASYVLRVNGTDRPVTEAWVGESLLYVLRERLGLAGAKDGCSQGECGACNVQVDGRLVASCLVPAATAAGSEVRTVEGLAVDGEPSDVQRALAACGAVQCGFCIPGMAMTVHDLLEGNHAPTELETRQALCGNLCRCSGYRGVLDAVREVVAGREAQSAAASEASAAAAAAAGAEEARIPHQAGPGAGGVQPPHTHDGGMA
ncbi:2Fe-2S iron-sulfur cluster-binding protein [Streptomyces sp. NPDC058301]|uniref:2Fe-2S iron-sulfur cluster-binding protein n=1 Tax=Streptomyces sp. NPDC058301 TaxID=3346436 RepID=UPI0036EBA500